jgi:hypothetical protein
VRNHERSGRVAGGQAVISIIVRYVIVVLALWVLWKLYTTLFPARRSPREQDEWGEVLEAIDELPETTDPHLQVRDPHQPSGAQSQANIEFLIIQEAETALSLIRKGDETKRLAGYHEIITYEKLCQIADENISEETRTKIDDIRRQAHAILYPPDRN